MTSIEKWNLIVKDYYANKNAVESVVQRLWEDYFTDADLFAYSRRGGEVDAQRQIQIGSYQRVIPDIIVRNAASNNDLFIVELKQYNLVGNDNYKNQLFSYMRLLHLDIGVLICNKIHICTLDSDNIESAITIDFAENNPAGIKFVELFDKHSFNANAVKDFINESQKLQKEVKAIRNELKTLSIEELLKTYFSTQYSAEAIDTALGNIHITIKFGNPPSEPEPIPIPPEPGPNKGKRPTPNPNSNEYAEPDFDYVIIKTTDSWVNNCGGNLYEATRYAWNAKLETIQKYRYVFSVINKIIRAVYVVDKWQKVTSGKLVGRVEFFGHEAAIEISNQFVGKTIPWYYRKPGQASPVLYKIH